MESNPRVNSRYILNFRYKLKQHALSRLYDAAAKESSSLVQEHAAWKVRNPNDKKNQSKGKETTFHYYKAPISDVLELVFFSMEIQGRECVGRLLFFFPSGRTELERNAVFRIAECGHRRLMPLASRYK